METVLGIELGSASKVIIGLILVLALIGIAAWLIRRFGEGGLAGASGRNRQQRLAVLDTAAVDPRRKLVLIRRDNVEHLILIGGPTDVVVEQNIVRAAPAGGNARPSARTGAADDDEASIVPEPAAADSDRAATATRSGEPPRTMSRPAPQRIDPQYADMAQRLEQALRKPAGELDVPRGPASAPAAPASRAPEPRILEPRPVVAPVPRAPAPREPVITPPPRPVQPVQIASPTPPPAQGQQSAADVFGSLEEEMASLLRPGVKKENK
jgi:hypothetical protein